jgi:hypothetical protein
MISYALWEIAGMTQPEQAVNIGGFAGWRSCSELEDQVAQQRTNLSSHTAHTLGSACLHQYHVAMSSRCSMGTSITALSLPLPV